MRHTSAPFAVVVLLAVLGTGASPGLSAEGPSIIIRAPKTGSSVAQDTVALLTNVRAEAGLSDVSVRVNGVKVYGAEDLSLSGRLGIEQTIDRPVGLSEGDNVIRILVSDREGRQISETVLVTYVPSPSAPEPEDLRDPMILISSPTPNLSVVDEKLTIVGTVFDDREVIRVTVNGQEVQRSRGIAMIAPHEEYPVRDTFPFTVPEFPLVPGANFITVAATDGSGRIAKQVVRVNRILLPLTGEVVATDFDFDLWAVIVGISEYGDSKIPDLQYADRDAQAIYDFLRTPYGGGFKENHVKLLLNREATKKNVESALGTFLKKAQKDDLVFIFFAGHGSPEPGRADELYFLPCDARLDDLFATAIGMSTINDILTRRIYAEKVVLIADACHSGTIGTAGFRAVPEITNKFFNWLASAKDGRAIFTASGGTELSMEDAKFGGGHGAFTYYLLEGLKGAGDGNGDGVVTIREAYDYTYRNVAKETDNNQHPELKGNFDNKIPLAVVK